MIRINNPLKNNLKKSIKLLTSGILLKKIVNSSQQNNKIFLQLWKIFIKIKNYQILSRFNNCKFLNSKINYKKKNKFHVQTQQNKEEEDINYEKFNKPLNQT